MTALVVLDHAAQAEPRHLRCVQAQADDAAAVADHLRHHRQVDQFGGGDEVRFLAGMAPVAMGSPREEIARMIRLVGAGEPWPRRLRTLAKALTDSKGGERLLSAHCEVGARLATDMGLPQGVSSALGVAYARWDGRGVPAGLAGEEIPVSVRVSIVARDVELWVREAGPRAAHEVLVQRRGRAPPLNLHRRHQRCWLWI